jgi:hypothetical protein
MNDPIYYEALPIGNKKQHLYANYVLQELILKGYIKVNNNNLFPINLEYLSTFCQKEIESNLKNKLKKQNIKSTKIPVKVTYAYDDENVFITLANKHYQTKINNVINK